MPDTASEIARLRAALAASEARAEATESELAQARAVVSTSEAMIKHLKLEIDTLPKTTASKVPHLLPLNRQLSKRQLAA